MLSYWWILYRCWLWSHWKSLYKQLIIWRACSNNAENSSFPATERPVCTNVINIEGTVHFSGIQWIPALRTPLKSGYLWYRRHFVWFQTHLHLFVCNQYPWNAEPPVLFKECTIVLFAGQHLYFCHLQSKLCVTTDNSIYFAAFLWYISSNVGVLLDNYGYVTVNMK